MTIEQAVERSRQLDIGMTITEHMDLEYPKPQAFIFNIAEYFAAYERYRSDRLLLGIEIGMRNDCLQENCRLVAEYPFDFVIGSIHVIDNIDIYLSEFYRRPKQEVYERYFNAMYRCVECYDCIHSLGHIDYIARYARYEDPEIHYHEFAQVMDPVLRALAEKDKAMEINTRRLEQAKVKQALMPIYQRFSELGGKMVTLGSDAHRPEDIAKHMDAAREIAERAKLRPVYFKHGLPEYF
jgi:histidinol-phosphatase (PHP family)